MEMPVAKMDNILEGTSFGESHRHSFGHAEFDIRVYIQEDDVKQAVGYMTAVSGRHLGWKHTQELSEQNCPESEKAIRPAKIAYKRGW